MLPREAAGAPAAIAQVSARGAERRRSAATLVAALMNGGPVSTEPRAARERFEEELRLTLHARSVVLCDDPRAFAPSSSNAVCFDVPFRTGATRARIEVTFDRPAPLDDWTCQLLDVATLLAALVLDLERAAGRLSNGKRPGDGAAPLIGSSEAIRHVRDRIERVAATDFTVLIEGSSRR